MSMSQLGIVKRNIVRADAAAVDKLSRFGVATIHEAMGRVGLMQTYLRPIYVGAHLCGPAVTVLLQPGDNWMLHVVAEQIQDGDVVVAACTTANDDGFFGDLLATSFRARGARGLVIDGGVRDVKDLAAMPFPVFSRGIDPKTGNYFDDTKKYVDGCKHLSDSDKHKIFEGNARRVYPRLDAALKAKGK